MVSSESRLKLLRQSERDEREPVEAIQNLVSVDQARLRLKTSENRNDA